MRFARVLLAVVPVFFGTGLPARGEPDLAQVLGKGLKTMRVTSVDRVAGSVQFLPIMPILGKPGDESSGQPICISAGNMVVIQGLLGFFASPEEIADLETRAKAELGSGVPVIGARPDSFSAVLSLNGKEVLNRPAAAGSVTGIPLQIMALKPSETATLTVDLQAVLFWHVREGARESSASTVEVPVQPRISSCAGSCWPISSGSLDTGFRGSASAVAFIGSRSTRETDRFHHAPPVALCQSPSSRSPPGKKGCICPGISLILRNVAGTRHTSVFPTSRRDLPCHRSPGSDGRLVRSGEVRMDAGPFSVYQGTADFLPVASGCSFSPVSWPRPFLRPNLKATDLFGAF